MDTNTKTTLYTRDEIAEILRVSRGFLDHAADDGPPFYRIGRAIRYDLQQVMMWLDAQSYPRLDA